MEQGICDHVSGCYCWDPYSTYSARKCFCSGHGFASQHGVNMANRRTGENSRGLDIFTDTPYLLWLHPAFSHFRKNPAVSPSTILACQECFTEEETPVECLGGME